MNVSLTKKEASALLSVLHGAQDDLDDFEAPGYAEAIHSAQEKIIKALNKAKS